MKRPEQALQRLCLTKLWRDYRVGYPVHIPNEGRRGKIEGYNNKLNGVRAGALDMPVIRPHGRIDWLEFKVLPNRLSTAQVEFCAELTQREHRWWLIYNVDQLTPIIAQWLKEDAENDAFIEKWKP